VAAGTAEAAALDQALNSIPFLLSATRHTLLFIEKIAGLLRTPLRLCRARVQLFVRQQPEQVYRRPFALGQPFPIVAQRWNDRRPAHYTAHDAVRLRPPVRAPAR
jgi:hypothetical protein